MGSAVSSLRNNQLAALSPEIEQLRALTYLDLSENQLTAIPGSITRCAELRGFYLTGNPLLPTAPDGSSLGRAELRAHFGDRVEMNEPRRQDSMPHGTTREQVYRSLEGSTCTHSLRAF